MTASRGPNPSPRAALRKAPDADIHPATTRPRGSTPPPATAAPTTTTAPSAEPAPAPRAKKPTQTPAAAPSGKRPAAKAASGGGTRPQTAGKPSNGKAAGAKGGATPKRKFGGTTSDVLRPAPDSAAKLLRGKPVTLEVTLPKRLRTAAQANAKTHGVDLDAVVTGLLVTWLDRT